VDTRDFEALYYTQVADEESDYYAFWHSSQTGTGGLNIADYSNEEVDELLEETRVLSDKQERIQRYEQIQKLIIQDLPVIPILSPKYFYVQGKKVKGFETSSIYSPKDRFSNISNWYIKTGEKLVW
jgi:ABC-type transport system substrate-binding protein